MNFEKIARTIVQQYRLDPWGTHGIDHWARVTENGLRLAAQTGADGIVVRLFALFHDSRRWNERNDPYHGKRGAEFMMQNQGILFKLSCAQQELLARACSLHTIGSTDPDITVQTCWDADRLDLGRCHVTPDPHFLCTKAAKQADIICWAEERGRNRDVPAFVAERWGLHTTMG